MLNSEMSKALVVRPWQTNNWMTKITTWLGSVLQGEVTLGEPYAHDLAFVVRVQTKGETYYFKTGDKTREAGVTAYLYQEHSHAVPEVIACDKDKDWLLTKDAGRHLSDFAKQRLWQTALSTLATLQQQIEVAPLQDLGCPRDEFASLAARGEAFLRDSHFLHHWGMTEEQTEKLRSLAPDLCRAQRNVAGLGLKECGVHGDAHPMNVLVSQETPVWFDWREARIAHPFVDAGWFLAWTFLPRTRDLELARTPQTATHLWNAYLGSFGLTSEDVAMIDAMTLALMSRALWYHERFYTWQSSTPDVRPNYVNYCLRLLLRSQESGFEKAAP